MRSHHGFPTPHRRRWARLGFVLAAIQAPVSTEPLPDESRLFGRPTG